jgi:hypothetical protein
MVPPGGVHGGHSFFLHLSHFLIWFSKILRIGVGGFEQSNYRHSNRPSPRAAGLFLARIKNFFAIYFAA